MYEKLKEQIDLTHSNIEHGTVGREDRIFLTHVLELFRGSVDLVAASSDLHELAVDLIETVESTNEFIEDGLIQDQQN